MTVAQAAQEERDLLRVLFGVLNPSLPAGEKFVYPGAVIEELAAKFILHLGTEKAIESVRDIIFSAAACRSCLRGDIGWTDADKLCSKALSLYIGMVNSPDTYGFPPEYDERKRDELFIVLSSVYWSVPDRLVGEREEKTNCEYYLFTEPCMLATKEVIFGEMAGLWRLDRTGDRRAFGFLCDVFRQRMGSGSTPAKTYDKNITVLKGHERDKYPRMYSDGHEPVVDEGRHLLKVEEDLLSGIILKRHQHTKPTVEQLRPWYREDLPEQILKTFQDALIRSGDRGVLEKLLGSEDAATT